MEVRKPQPHVKKIVETRYTTIRYPVFITQVIKPVLTQVETKVRGMGSGGEGGCVKFIKGLVILR